jgi:hypothetical protein
MEHLPSYCARAASLSQRNAPVVTAGRKAFIESLTLLTLRNFRSPDKVKSDVIDGISQSDLARQLLKDMPVENPATNKLHTLTHHFE